MMQSTMILTLPLLSLVAISSAFFIGFQPPFHRVRSINEGTTTSQYLIISALEQLPSSTTNMSVSWLDDDIMDSDEKSILHEAGCNEEFEWQTVPLYPLPAVYLPTGESVNYTLNNVEQRNIQMALDLGSNMTAVPGCFCAVLRAVDTGRIASVGTLMRIREQRVERNKAAANAGISIRRVILTCTAESLVRIRHIVNPEALSSLSYKLQNPSVYAKASVAKLPCDDDGALDIINASLVSHLQNNLTRDFNSIRDLLLDPTKNMFSCFRRSMMTEKDELSDYFTPIVSPLDFGPRSFWDQAAQWQVFCNTFQEDQRLNFVSQRNEMLVHFAMQKPGPLKLPVDVSSLDPQDRQSLEEWEMAVQREWAEQLQCLHPVIPFQCLIQHSDSYIDRLQWLATLVHQAVTFLSSSDQHVMLATKRPQAGAVEPSEALGQLRGAWFDDDMW